ncbi:YicC/YloC family endoribonuclease [Chitinivibrio alkaliphilus]|uniref:YicC family protein n=1 Tax=Chitinivibrio alkaliphilus ACht1 TaxID=1313304 RepID=U7D426_9BACT|nr:YicC/YloC family endoribonuclease [Chitinivibrio alkaliphilus]ERP31264.1 hypothetical protein CALK_1883 [Chitinivibrio alkaliphilus ACht1]
MPLVSMTGFGSSEIERPSGFYKVEIKSVNNRYLSIQYRAPRMFNALEARVRKRLSDVLIRGSVHVSIHHELPDSEKQVSHDSYLAGKYVTALQQMAQEHGIDDHIGLDTLSPFYKEIITHESPTFDEQQLWEDLSAAVEAALVPLVEQRRREGAFIQDEFLQIITTLVEGVEQIFEVAPQRLERYREKLATVFREYQNDSCEETRFYTEVALMAEKFDITEEITRLRAHVEALKSLIDRDESGKKINFMLQELGREINTIGSKANDITISEHVVELKEQVEKIREQALNIL